MAIIQILKSASRIQRGHTLSVAQIKSIGGIRKAQRRGPYLYDFEVEVIVLPDNSDEYYNIEAEISSQFQYGVATVKTQMPTVEVKNRGTWDGSPTVRGAGQTGTSINLQGLTKTQTNIIMANDWVQFTGLDKVYQVISNASSDSSGNVTIVLNTPLVGTLANAVVVKHGSAVEFKLALINPSSVDPVKSPASTSYSLAQYGKFILEEVI